MNVVDHSDAESEVPFFTYFGSPENWIVDSGATDHMSPFGSDFRDYITFAESRSDNTHWGQRESYPGGKLRVF